ncbi:MAG TPA: DUF4129 domain-containing protein [Candidatus Limnocylindria bacterium]|nr:DUF4129 domain-containing protein [Candidatus Limnocylindria bacterium]
MRSISSPEEALAALADASLEAAWLMLVYLLVQPWIGDGELHLGLPALAVAVLAGLLFARAASDLPRDSYTLIGSGLTVLAAAIGVLAFVPDIARADPFSAFGAHPGGLLAGVAFLRGSAHAEEGAEARNVERILGIGLFGLVAFWLLFSLAGLAVLPEFAQPALSACITFVTACLLAMGLARLASLGSDGVGRPTRRRWLGLLFGVLGLALVVSLPLAAVLGVPLGVAVTGVLGPLGVVAYGLLVIITLPFAVVAGWLTEYFKNSPALAEILGNLFGNNVGSGLEQAPGPLTPGGDGSWVGTVLLVTLLAVVAILIIVRMLGRRTVRTRLASDNEMRATELPTPQLHMPRIHLPQRSRAPRTAREAYLAVLHLLVGTDAARAVDETPAEHARRLRAADVSRLAADYQLDAFGGRALTAPEERRALDRWRRVKRRSPRAAPSAVSSQAPPSHPPAPNHR